MEHFFEALQLREQRCRECSILLDIGVNTTYSDKKKAHLCNKCGTSVN